MELKTKRYWFVVALLLVTGIYVHILRYTRIKIQEQVNLKALPMKIGEWQSNADLVIDEETQEILKSSQDLWRSYTNSNMQEIELFIAYFKDQKYGEQIHSPVHCLPAWGREITNKETFDVPIPNSSFGQLKINKLIVTYKRYNEIVFYWFWTRSGVITSEYDLKFSLAKNALLRRPTDAALVQINLPFTSQDRSEKLRIAAKFIAEILPAVKQSLPFKN
jgi:EpsI family protein